MIKTRSDATQVWVVNQGAGASSTSIVNSAGWVVAVSNTAGITTNIINSAGWIIAQSNTVSAVDITAYSAGVSKGVPIMGERLDTNSTVFDSNLGILRIDALRGLFVNIRDAALNERGANVNAAGELGVRVGSTSIVNSAGWVVNAIDSSFAATSSKIIVSTIGTVVLAAANAVRRTFAAYNFSANPLFLKLGSGAKVSDFTLMMVSSGYYELPAPAYTGVITGVWGTADGNAQITEGT